MRQLHEGWQLDLGRHPKTIASTKGLRQGRWNTGNAARLSQEGVQQMIALGQFLVKEGRYYDAILLPDLFRNKTLAEFLTKRAGHTKAQIITDVRLTERSYGNYEGQPNHEIDALKAKMGWEAMGFEAPEAIEERVMESLRFWQAKLQGKRVLYIANGGVLAVLLNRQGWVEADDWRKSSSSFMAHGALMHLREGRPTEGYVPKVDILHQPLLPTATLMAAE